MRKLISTEKMPFKKWLQIRKKGIGGSDIGAIMGLSPFKSALSCYLDKTDQAKKEDDENIPAELGLELEPYMAKKFKKWILEKEKLEIDLKEMKFIL